MCRYATPGAHYGEGGRPSDSPSGLSASLGECPLPGWAASLALVGASVRSERKPVPGTFTVLLNGAYATHPDNVSRVVIHPPKK
jgi:hypothetical protein